MGNPHKRSESMETDPTQDPGGGSATPCRPALHKPYCNTIFELYDKIHDQVLSVT